jgi:hypothetical protein
MKTIAAKVRGTMTAVDPMAVPIMNLVNGITKTIKIGKGIERVALITTPRTRYKTLFSKICPFRVITTSTPKGIPKRQVKTVETDTMYRDCKVEILSIIILLAVSINLAP